MARFWLRKCSLIIGNSSEGLGFSQGSDASQGFRFVFEIVKTTLQEPGQAKIRIYNLKPETEKRIEKEFQNVVLEAGYADPGAPYGKIFSGTVRQALRGRENPTDTYIDVLAADGEIAYNYSIVSKTISAGSTFKDQLKEVENATKEHGVSLGYITDKLSQAKFPRPRIFHAPARDILREIARANNCAWSIDDGKINMYPIDETRPGDAVVLNSKTGLIGQPTQTLDGIFARSLLNPNLKIGGTVKIDERSVARLPGKLDVTGELDIKTSDPELVPTVAMDGLYKIWHMAYVGDTHGQDWYVDLTLSPLNGTTPGTQKAFGFSGSI